MHTVRHYTLAALVLLGLLLLQAPVARAEQVRFHVGLSHPMLLEHTRQTAYLKVDLTGFAIQRPEDRTPVNVAIVLDKSGSMQGDKITHAKQAAIMAIDRLGPNDIVSVLSYDHTVQVLVPATKVHDKQAIRRSIRRLKANGHTALFAGVSKGVKELRKFFDKNRVNRVILLSDGQANVGPSTPSELGKLGAALGKQGISVTTIGLGLGYNEDLMTQLAQRSDGNHTFVEHPEQLVHIFNQEFGDVLSVVAQEVTITITCHDGFRPVRVLGREADIYGQRVVTTLNQLYSEQEKYVILEVETQPSLGRGTHEVAQVELSYANMLTKRTDTRTTTVAARFTPSPETVRQNVNPSAIVPALEQRAVENEEKAIELRDQGKKDEAQRLLSDNAKVLEESAGTYNAPALRSRATKNREAAQELQDDATWGQQRKEMRSDHYKLKKQQRY